MHNNLYSYPVHAGLIAKLKVKFNKLSFVLNLKYKVKPEGKTYPPSKFPEPESKLKGYIWRSAEQPLTKEAIFMHNVGDDVLLAAII